MGYSFRLAARVLLYASSHRQDNKYHGLCYTSRGTLAGTRTHCDVTSERSSTAQQTIGTHGRPIRQGCIADVIVDVLMLVRF